MTVYSKELHQRLKELTEKVPVRHVKLREGYLMEGLQSLDFTDERESWPPVVRIWSAPAAFQPLSTPHPDVVALLLESYNSVNALLEEIERLQSS